MTTLIIIGLFVFAALQFAVMLFTVASVGQPRRPITPGLAVGTTIFSLLWITITVTAAFTLMGK